MPLDLIYAFAMQKQAAAKANCDLKLLKDDIANKNFHYIMGYNLERPENEMSQSARTEEPTVFYIKILLEKEYFIELSSINEIIASSKIIKFFELDPLRDEENNVVRVVMGRYSFKQPTHTSTIYKVTPLYDETGTLIKTRRRYKTHLGKLSSKRIKSLSIKKNTPRYSNARKYESLNSLRKSKAKKRLSLFSWILKEYYHNLPSRATANLSSPSQATEKSSKLLNEENIVYLLRNRNINQLIFDWCIKNSPVLRSDASPQFYFDNPFDCANHNDCVVDYLLQNPDKINWEEFSSNTNPKAVKFLIKKQNKHNINWGAFSSNPHPKAVEHLLRKENKEKIQWHKFSSNSNPRAVQYLLRDENRKNIVWSYFCENENSEAVSFLLEEENRRHINWKKFCKNPNPLAVSFLINPEFKKRFNLEWLNENTNPEAIEYLLLNDNYVNYGLLSSNPTTEAVQYLLRDENVQHIDFILFSMNPNPYAIDYLRQNTENIDWKAFATNSGIFV
jgi:hypothetical protein